MNTITNFLKICNNFDDIMKILSTNKDILAVSKKKKEFMKTKEYTELANKKSELFSQKYKDKINSNKEKQIDDEIRKILKEIIKKGREFCKDELSKISDKTKNEFKNIFVKEIKCLEKFKGDKSVKNQKIKFAKSMIKKIDKDIYLLI